jgi:hypothetical protein
MPVTGRSIRSISTPPCKAFRGSITVVLELLIVASILPAKERQRIPRAGETTNKFLNGLKKRTEKGRPQKPSL